jgi:ParB-like nuclease domain
MKYIFVFYNIKQSMPYINLADLLSIHGIDPQKVKEMVRDLQDAGKDIFPNLLIREVDGEYVIIDGVHRAIALYLVDYDFDYELLIKENPYLTDEDIRKKRLFSVPNLASGIRL